MTNPLTHRVTAILSSAYSDSDFRQTLSSLEGRSIWHDAGTRRQLRLQLQREVIEHDGVIIDEFGKITDVRQVVTFVPARMRACRCAPVRAYGIFY